MANLLSYINGICQGRLTLTDGTAVTTSDVTAATTVYFDAYQGEYVGLYSGSVWVPYNIGSGLSIAVPATTATMYDVFLDYNDGTPQLAVTAWTNDTTRATALTLQDGVYVKTGDTQQRYLGSFRTTGVSGETEDSASNRLLWNYYNRVYRTLKRVDTTNTWNYSTSSYQQANASASNQLGIVRGVSEDNVHIKVLGSCANSGATLRYVNVGIGLDSTTTNSANVFGYMGCTSTAPVIVEAVYDGLPSAGYHYYAWLEHGGGSDTQTWRGDEGAARVQSGMTGHVFG
jgi:hypothetical protein